MIININAICVTKSHFDSVNIYNSRRPRVLSWEWRLPLSEQACRVGVTSALFFNTLRPRQHGRHFPDDIFKCIFFNENVLISLKISLKFIPNNWINHIPVLVQIMAWRRPGDKPLSEPMMICLLTHICVTRPQWGNFLLMGLQNAHPGSF